MNNIEDVSGCIVETKGGIFRLYIDGHKVDYVVTYSLSDAQVYFNENHRDKIREALNQKLLVEIRC